MVLWAWRGVVRWSTGDWGGSTRLRAEAKGGGPEWLSPGFVEELSVRPGISAVASGTVAAWLMAYARANAGARCASRKRCAAWRVRMEEGRRGWRRGYQAWVKSGLSPVKAKTRKAWKETCERMDGERERARRAAVGTEGSVTLVKRGVQGVVVEGEDGRLARKIARVLRQDGEQVQEGGGRAEATSARAEGAAAGVAAVGLRWRRAKMGQRALIWMRADFEAARGGDVQEIESREESDADGGPDGTGMEGGGAAPGEDGTIGVNGRERDGTDAPWVVELRNGDEADEEEQLEAEWREEIDGSEQMAEWPTEYEEQLAREWFADEHEERGQAFGDG